MGDLELARLKIEEIDREMAVLFAARMDAVREIGRYKAAHALPIEVPEREKLLLEKNLSYLSDADETVREEYASFFRNVLACSKDLQRRLIPSETTPRSFPDSVRIENGGIGRLHELLAGYEKVLVVTDNGVPAAYSAAVTAQCRHAFLLTIPEGEPSKSVENWLQLSEALLRYGFTREDAVVAVGGGVVGDLCGFGASTYLRGIDWINLPTTLLAQLDSSVGGKTAVNFGGIKNSIGSFYPPRKVVIDPTLLKTLPDRFLYAGLAEAIKMSASCDAQLFAKIENCADLREALPMLIPAAVQIKMQIVKEDRLDKSVRRVLNFGHTIGHALEAASKGKLLHGEAIGIGMLPMCGEAVRERMRRVLAKYGLPTAYPISPAELLSYMAHDKKKKEAGICCVLVDEIGKYRLEILNDQEILARWEAVT